MQTTITPAVERRTAPPWRTTDGAVTVALIGGAAWLLLAGDSIIGGDARRYRDAAFLVPWALTAATYWSVHRRQAPHAGPLERWGLRALLAGMTLMAAGQIHVVVADIEQNLAFPLAPVLFGLGTLAFGVGTVRAGVFPRRAGAMIAASEWLTVALALALSPWVPLSDDGNYSGAAMHGVTCLVVASALRMRSSGGTGGAQTAAALRA